MLTLGGYHPSFHRDGYPVVPRLGIAVDLYGFISIKGESYFALTSEALMAGGELEVVADFGPAWAHMVVRRRRHRLLRPVLARGHASTPRSRRRHDRRLDRRDHHLGVAVGARIEVTGPPFHGKATFAVGPVELEVEFGDSGSQPHAIDWATFVGKYLETAGRRRPRRS